MKPAIQIEVSFAIKDPADTVNYIGDYYPQNMSVQQVVDNVPGYWLQKDKDGTEHVCTIINYGDVITGSFADSDRNDYDCLGVNFGYEGFVGGRPIHRPVAV